MITMIRRNKEKKKQNTNIILRLSKNSKNTTWTNKSQTINNNTGHVSCVWDQSRRENSDSPYFVHRRSRGG